MKSRANEFLFTSHEISFHVIKSICWNDQTKRTISKGNGLKLDTVTESYQAYQAILQNTGRFDRDQMKSVKAVVGSHGLVCKVRNSHYNPHRCSACRILAISVIRLTILLQAKCVKGQKFMVITRAKVVMPGF